MLVLKRLSDAQKAGNRIYAVIRGIGTSSDGSTSAIYAPDANGQAKALNDAYDQAGIEPASVGLLEAHGTGTRVGDKVEFTALKACLEHPGRLLRTASSNPFPRNALPTTIHRLKVLHLMALCIRTLPMRSPSVR